MQRTMFRLNKAFDIGIFMVTGLPLYWCFVSTNLVYYAFIALIFHSGLALYITLNSTKLLIFQYSLMYWSFLRVRATTFQKSCPN